MGYIIVTAFKIKGTFPFIRILEGSIRSTYSLFHGVSSAILSGSLPFFFADRFVGCHTSHLVTSFWKADLMSGQ